MNGMDETARPPWYVWMYRRQDPARIEWLTVIGATAKAIAWFYAGVVQQNPLYFAFVLASAVLASMVFSDVRKRFMAERSRRKAYELELGTETVVAEHRIATVMYNPNYVAISRRVKAMCFALGGSPQEIFGEAYTQWLTYHSRASAHYHASRVRYEEMRFILSWSLDVDYLMSIPRRRRELGLKQAKFPLDINWPSIHAMVEEAIPQQLGPEIGPLWISDRFRTQCNAIAESLTPTEAFNLHFKKLKEGASKALVRRLEVVRDEMVALSYWTCSNVTPMTLQQVADHVVQHRIVQEARHHRETVQGESSGAVIWRSAAVPPNAPSGTFNIPLQPSESVQVRGDTTNVQSGVVRMYSPAHPFRIPPAPPQPPARPQNESSQPAKEPEQVNKPHDRFTFRKLRAKGSTSGGDKADTSEGWPARLVSPNHPARNYLVQLANSEQSHSEEWWRDLFRTLDMPEPDPDEAEGDEEGEEEGVEPIEDGPRYDEEVEEFTRRRREVDVAAMDETEEEYDESEEEDGIAPVSSQERTILTLRTRMRDRSASSLQDADYSLIEERATAAMSSGVRNYGYDPGTEGLHTFLGGPGLSLTPEGRALTRNQLIEGLRGQSTPDLQAIARESLIATQRGDHPIVALLPVDTIEIHYQGALFDIRFIDFLRRGQRIARQNIAPLQGEGTTHVRLENLVMFLPVTGTLSRA